MEKFGNSKYSEEQIREIIAEVLKGKSFSEVSRLLGVSLGHISTIMYLRAHKTLPHTKQTIAAWRAWLAAPKVNTTNRSKTGRGHILKHFDRHIKCSDLLRKVG